MRLRSMPIASLRVAVTALLIVTLGFAAPAAADELGFFEVRKVGGQAEKALANGDLSAAVDLYGRLIEGATGDRRTEALYFAAVAELGRDGGKPSTARGWLDTLLSEAPRHELAPQARALVRVLEQVAGVQQQVDAAMASAARQAEQHDDREEQAAGEVESLSSQVERLAAELRATRAELAKKEEAIEKLKKVVSGGDG